MKLFSVTFTILSAVGTAVVAAQETPAPTPAMTSTQSTACWQVSVEGDATFCIEGPICSGSGSEPAGTNCPKIGDVATAECWDYVPSYADAEGCVAPVNAECKPIETGVWGCVWNTGSGSGSGMEDVEAGSSSMSGSGSGAMVTIPVNATSAEAANPEDIQFPNLKANTLSAEGSSSSTVASAGAIVGIIAAVAGVVCAIAAAAYYRHKQTRREQVSEFAEAILTPDSDAYHKTNAGRTPLTPPFSKTNV